MTQPDIRNYLRKSIKLIIHWTFSIIILGFFLLGCGKNELSDGIPESDPVEDELVWFYSRYLENPMPIFDLNLFIVEVEGEYSVQKLASGWFEVYSNGTLVDRTRMDSDERGLYLHPTIPDFGGPEVRNFYIPVDSSCSIPPEILGNYSGEVVISNTFFELDTYHDTATLSISEEEHQCFGQVSLPQVKATKGLWISDGTFSHFSVSGDSLYYSNSWSDTILEFRGGKL